MNAVKFSEKEMRFLNYMRVGCLAIEQGGDFDKAKTLLQAKFLQYNDLFAIKQGESVILRFNPTRAVTWDYIAGELNEPH
jgi:hypothetical protein